MMGWKGIGLCSVQTTYPKPPFQLLRFMVVSKHLSWRHWRLALELPHHQWCAAQLAHVFFQTDIGHEQRTLGRGWLSINWHISIETNKTRRIIFANLSLPYSLTSRLLTTSPVTMAAINPLVVRELSELVKRKSWPAKNVGVMVVFCIVFIGM